MRHTVIPIVELREVVKSYPRFDVGPVDLELSRGRALGVVGQNGAGKSTLLRILVGLVRHDAGEVLVLLIVLITATMVWRQGRKTSFV